MTNYQQNVFYIRIVSLSGILVWVFKKELLSYCV